MKIQKKDNKKIIIKKRKKVLAKGKNMWLYR